MNCIEYLLKTQWNLKIKSIRSETCPRALENYLSLGLCEYLKDDLLFDKVCFVKFIRIDDEIKSGFLNFREESWENVEREIIDKLSQKSNETVL